MTREEAIKEAYGISVNKKQHEALQILIPELRESEDEDERIRKYLIEELKAAKSVGELKFTIPQPTREECIAYLEKQEIFSKNGEGCYYYDADGSYTFIGSWGFGPIEDIKINGERPKTENKGVDLPDACLCVEKQKEQKPSIVEKLREISTPVDEDWFEIQTQWEKEDEQKLADLSEMMVHKEPYIAPVPTPMVADEQKSAEPTGKLSREEYLYQLLIDQLITYSDYEYLTGKNPAWSVEDKAFLKVAIAICNKYSHKDTADWLKSLPERFNLQPKVEWSEEDIKKIRSEEYTKGFNDAAFGGKLKEWSKEDENMAYFVNQFLEYHENADPTAKSCKKWFNNRFKSLKPHWKPSEEQMEALKDAVRLFKETHFEKFHYKIESLYEQLEKLYYERGLSA